MKVAVTGASGFLGKYVVKSLLKKEYDVVCFVRKENGLGEVEYRLGDIRSKKDVINAFNGVDVVVHLVAIYNAINKKEAEDINVKGVRNVIEACKINKVKKLIHISSLTVVRKKKGLYGKTKKKGEELLSNSGLNFVALRPSMIYGKVGSSGFGKIVDYVNLPLFPVVGNGKIKIQPVYAGDVADLIIKMVKVKNKDRFYDVAGEEVVTFNKFVDIIMGILGKKRYKLYFPKFLGLFGVLVSKIIRKPIFTMDNYYGVVQDTTASIDKIKKEFGFKPVKLEEGLRKSLIQ